MNKDRRARIKGAVKLMEEALEILETCRDEEQEAYDNLSEGLQQSERGQATEQAAENLSNAYAQLEEAIGEAMGAAE